MKKIRTKSSESKKQKRNQMIVGIVLVFVMFGSVFGVIVNSFGQNSNSKVEYNGVEFVGQNGFWFASKGNFNFIFRNNPEQVEEIDSELNYFNSYEGKPLYIYSEDGEAELEVLRNFFYENQVVQRVQSACLNESADIFNRTSECGEDVPVKDCYNNFIIIREDNDTKIVQDKNCVFIQGQNLTEITDEFLFNVFGIR